VPTSPPVSMPMFTIYTHLTSCACSRICSCYWICSCYKIYSSAIFNRHFPGGPGLSGCQPRFCSLVHTCIYSVSQKIPPPLMFSDIFPKRLGIFSPDFTYLLSVPIYAGLQIFIQLFAILTKLCHCIFKMSTIGQNARRHFLTFSPNSWEFLV